MIDISIDDLKKFIPDLDEEKAEILIKDALAMAILIAPCIEDDDFPYADAAEAIIRGAILRWYDSSNNPGTSSVSLTAGEFTKTESFDTNSPRRNLFMVSEKRELEDLCKKSGNSAAFTITPGPSYSYHPLAYSWVNGPYGMAPGERDYCE